MRRCTTWATGTGPSTCSPRRYEATSFVVRHHVDLAAEAGFEARRIVATGGGTRNPALMQTLADGTGLPVDVAAVPEGAALGAAFLARCVAGLESSPQDAAQLGPDGPPGGAESGLGGGCRPALRPLPGAHRRGAQRVSSVAARCASAARVSVGL